MQCNNLQAGSKILKANTLKALYITGENEENSANRQVQDNLITLTSVFSCIDFTSCVFVCICQNSER